MIINFSSFYFMDVEPPTTLPLVKTAIPYVKTACQSEVVAMCQFFFFMARCMIDDLFLFIVFRGRRAPSSYRSPTRLNTLPIGANTGTNTASGSVFICFYIKL